MKKFLISLITLLAIFNFTADAKAATLISSQSEWNYKLFNNNLTGAMKDGTVTYDSFSKWNSKKWKTGSGTFGNKVYNTSEIPTVNGLWHANRSIALKQSFELTEKLQSLTLKLAIDNGAAVFINGQKIFSSYAEGYTTRDKSGWEYVVENITPDMLVKGTNTVSVIGTSYLPKTCCGKDYTAFDMELTGAPVPEPSTMFLGFLGASGLLRLRRRRK